MSSPISLIVFDVNGTLLDDREIFCQALNQIFVHYDHPALSEDELRQRFSQPWINLYRDAGISENEADESDFYRLYDQFYSSAPPPRLAPGARQSLLELRDSGYDLAIISTQRNQLTLPLLRELKIIDCFAQVLGEVADKSESLKELAQQTGLRPQQIAYVGDQDSDMVFAKHAECLAIAYTQGLHTEERLAAAGADLLFSDFADLKELIETHSVPAR